ncbi:hypothetical protein [Streptomyces sp. NPDC001594]|uniref:hypothetical protein n=1 Tax=Streptomyces sp. NPDC001594 TaxID=3364590 RepID=UPI003689ED67
MIRPWPAGLSASDLTDYHQAQADHDDLMQQVADREFQMETGLIDSYGDYHFIWQDDGHAELQPPTAVPGQETGNGAWAGCDGTDEPPF